MQGVHALRSVKRVSIHAPARGATRRRAVNAGPGLGFNPRTREGCDARHHGPVRAGRHGFNPRTREGCDFRQGIGNAQGVREFQSTHPRGVRLTGGDLAVRDGGVSIHAPARGATSATLPTSYCGTVFQSTHPRGVRHHALRVDAVQRALVSIHAPARGATGRGTPVRLPAGKFQSTHPRGVRRGSLL